MKHEERFEDEYGHQPLHPVLIRLVQVAMMAFIIGGIGVACKGLYLAVEWLRRVI
jgi:hypothetical protein